jgi:threonine/homoserine/homoserine lactone efflux protein
MVTNPLNDPQWADRMVDLIDRFVVTIRRYTTQPVVKGARGLVFGLLASFGVVAIIILFLLGLTRGVQEGLDAFLARDTAVWISYFLLGGIFLGLGAALMRARHGDEDDEA